MSTGATAKRGSMLAAIGSDLAPADEPVRAAETPAEPGPTVEAPAPRKAARRAPRPRREPDSPAGEGPTQADAAAEAAELLRRASADPDRYLVDRYGVRGLRHGRNFTMRLPRHLDEGLERYVGAEPGVRTRASLVCALLDAYLTGAGILPADESSSS